MSDLNFYNQSFTKEMAAKNRCCLYERLPVSYPDGRTAFNVLMLSPGHTLVGEEVGSDQVADLTQNLLDVKNLPHLLFKGSSRIMVQSVPSSEWLLYRNHIPEKHLIIRLPDSYVLKNGEDRIMLGMRAAGAQFAMKLGKMGSLPQNPELLKCLDYVLIEHGSRSGLMTAYNGLKVKLPELKCIGLKPYGDDFTLEEAAEYDLVYGPVAPSLIAYEGARPKWQHELMRTIAELFSGIYNPRDIVKLGVKYPELGTAIKGLLGSAKLMEMVAKRSANPGLKGTAPRFNQSNILNIMSLSVGYAMVCEAEKAQHGGKDQTVGEAGLAYFRQAVIGASLIGNLARKVCDDYETEHSFIVGLMLFLPKFIRDTPESCFREFSMSAITSFYGETFSTLAMVVGAYKALRLRDIDKISEYSERIGLSFSKEEYYRDYFEAMLLADEVVRTIVRIKAAASA